MKVDGNQDALVLVGIVFVGADGGVVDLDLLGSQYHFPDAGPCRCRSVLAYVQDKFAALQEFHRILKPGGRLSIAEPVFQDEAFTVAAMRQTLEGQSAASKDRVLELLHRWKSAQFPDTSAGISANTVTNYNERDLLNLFVRSGFSTIHMELHIDRAPTPILTWAAFTDIAPLPGAPTLKEILTEQFTSGERLFFEHVFRPLVECRKSFSIDRMAYVNASKL